MDTTSTTAPGVAKACGTGTTAPGVAEKCGTGTTAARVNISQRLIDGRKIARLKYVDSDSKTIGNLRAGNTGIMSEKGEVAAACHRIAHLRQLGIAHDPPSSSTVIMFQVGTANEDIIYNDLVQTSAEDEVILRETEVPTCWSTPNGTLVTGRPDAVLHTRVLQADERNGISVDLIPTLGLELKSIASIWTTRAVLVDNEPKLAHLAQAGHYSWRLGIPFRLIYKQYSLQEMGEFATRFFPAQGSRGSEYVEYDSRTGKPWRVLPFEIVFELSYSRDGYLRYRREPAPGMKADKWTHTIVAKKDIERFFVFVSEMGPDKKLGPVPVNVDMGGNKKSKSFCKDCKLKTVCQSVRKVKDSKEQYEQWLSAVRELVGAPEVPVAAINTTTEPTE